MNVYIMSGISGSGKTTFAKNFVREHPDVLYIGSDELRAELGKNESDQSVSREAFDTMYWLMEACLSKNGSIILDAMFLHSKARKRFVSLARKYGATITIFVTSVSVDECIARNKNRERKVPEDIIRGQASRFRPPLEGEVDIINYVKSLKV